MNSSKDNILVLTDQYPVFQGQYLAIFAHIYDRLLTINDRFSIIALFLTFNQEVIVKESRQKIREMSRILKILFMIAACSLPVLNAGYWITSGYPFLPGWAVSGPFPHFEGIVPLSEMSGLIKFLGFLVTLIPTSFNVFAFVLLSKLFRTFENLEFFSKSSVQCLRKMGYCILLNQLIYPVFCALISFTLTMSNPPGSRMISISLGTPQFSLLIIGSIIILISWIMDEGRKMQEEQAATV